MATQKRIGEFFPPPAKQPRLDTSNSTGDSFDDTTDDFDQADLSRTSSVELGNISSIPDVIDNVISAADDSSTTTDVATTCLDIGHYCSIGATISATKRLTIVKNVWRPDTNYVFPKVFDGKQNRRFNRKFLDDSKYQWLAYSHLKSGLFCRGCVLFLVNRDSMANFVKEPFQDYHVSSIT